MDRDVYTAVLRNTLNEIGNLCPEVKCSFLFDRDNTIIASSSGAQDEILKRSVETLSGVFEKADSIGGLESFIVDGVNGKAQLSRLDSMYLTVVAEAETDMKYLQTVTHVVIPTIIKMLKNLSPTLLKQPSPETTRKEEPKNEFTVAVMRGLFVRRDTVRIDPEALSKWAESLGNEWIDMVEVEGSNGKAVKCKVRAISDPELKGKRIIEVPEKLCSMLNVEEGDTVKVKPLVS